MTAQLWRRVEELVDRARDPSDLREHRLELVAARRWRELGRAVPDDLREQERMAAVTALAVPAVLERIRAALSGPIVLLKGPELAVLYPDPALRIYQDLDILVPDAQAAHAALRDAGFREVGDAEKYVGIHHLRPLALPPLPLQVEHHSRPKWIDALEPPPTSERLDAAVPSSVGVHGISTLRPDHHALVLAAHSWAHEPLRRLVELIDVAAVSADVDRRDLLALADAWRMRRLWQTTISTVDAVLDGGSQPLPLRLWARNLPAVRRRTVLESHLARLFAGFWALPPATALRAAFVAAGAAVGPAEGETWGDKLRRMWLALRHASAPRSQHDSALERRRRE